MAVESELIYITARAGISWTDAMELEPWQLAAAIGVHRVETREDHDNREIIEAKRAYFEETGEARQAHMAGYSERRRAQAEARKEEKRRQREEMSDAR
jgi:hypothetical protein